MPKPTIAPIISTEATFEPVFKPTLAPIPESPDEEPN